MRLSVELVPRSASDFAAQLGALARQAHGLVAAGFDTVNVPSAPRYDLDAIRACERVAARGWHGIPHIRSMDVRICEIGRLARRLEDARVREVLVVAGDPPRQGGSRAPETTPDVLLRRLAEEVPHIRRHAAFDPNRAPDRSALERIDAKIGAGAEGFFAQPVFDPTHIATWREAMAPRVRADRVFWGAAPVLSERSMQWWRRVNGVAFPGDFTPTLTDWALRAPRLYDAARAAGGHLYVMPIRAPIAETLAPLARAPVAHSA